MSVRKHYIIIGNQRHGYTLQPARKVTMVICKSANIEAQYPNDEIPALLAGLPQTIEHYAGVSTEPQTQVLRFRATESEKDQIEQNAYDAGYENVSAYLRDTALQKIEFED